jgi:hypothetical protein
MTLDDLYTQIVPTFTPSTQKDLKTAVRALAQALAYPDPTSCSLEACLLPLPIVLRKVEASLLAQGKGLHTIRNVKNNLSRLFRSAESQGLYTPPPIVLSPRFDYQQRAPRPGGEVLRPDGTYLRYHRWPSALQAEFERFRLWATDPMVADRDARWKKRPASINSYQRLCEAYFGFVHHQQQVAEPAFDDLFDIVHIKSFVQWHVNVKLKRSSHTIRDFIKLFLALTNQYHPHPSLRRELLKLRRTLPTPAPVYNKNDAWVPLLQLKQIGESVWPSKRPEDLPTVASRTAARAGLALMLQLWAHIPYRQRNMREMALETNLQRDPRGTWRISFVGEQLKIALKKGRTNIFDLPFPEPLVPTLETYLSVWHPILTHRADPGHQRLVFLNAHGQPYTGFRLRRNLQNIVYRYTGKYWHPHIIRTVWATEYIRSTGDFLTVAVMLNDTLETVIKNYAHLRDENVAEEAYQWLSHQH